MSIASMLKAADEAKAERIKKADRKLKWLLAKQGGDKCNAHVRVIKGRGIIESRRGNVIRRRPVLAVPSDGLPADFYCG